MTLRPQGLLQGFRFRPLLTLVTLPVLLALIGLSIWQFQRLGWKSRLIEQAQTGLSQPATLFDSSEEPDPLKPYIVRGELRPAQSINLYGHRVMGVTGAHHVSLLVLENGQHLALNRGWVPQDWQDADLSPRPFEARVILRKVAGTRGFDPANANVPERGIWIYAVPHQLAEVWGVADILEPVAYELRASEQGFSPHNDQVPLGHLPKVNLHNNHLGYALTWLALAAALLGIYGILSLERGRIEF